ncbi:MAG: FixH family protein [Pseudomonadales bacterium]
MKTQEQYAADPWYKQPWLLFALTPLVATVIVGTSWLVISIISADGIVKDDHYKIAKGYFRDPSKLQLAFDKQISADINLDNLTGDITLNLSGQFETYPKLLTLDVVSPTHQKYDANISLKQVADQPFYIGSLPGPLKGKRYLILNPEDNSWRLRTEIAPPYDQRTFKLTATAPQQ